MIKHAEQLQGISEFDVCVIGSGPAGITIATSLARNFGNIAILEAGELEFTRRSQEAYRGRVTGDPYFPLETSRLRFFGGTSNHWTGHSRPLDEADFNYKDYQPLAHWPINKIDLSIYTSKTCEMLGIPQFDSYELVDEEHVRRIHWERSSVKFAEKFRSDIELSNRITLFYDAAVQSIENDQSRVNQINVATSNGHPIRIHSKVVVLAAGGIENSRLLLWSNRLAKEQFIKQPASLGKYWMDHPHYRIGEVIITGPRITRTDPRDPRVFYAPSPAAMRRDQSLNCGLKISEMNYANTKKLVADLACVAPELGHWFAGQLEKNLICGNVIRAAWELAPVATNRIQLDSEPDRFGVPRVHLHWQKSLYDIRTARRAAMSYAKYLAKSGTGRVNLLPWLLNNGPFPRGSTYAGNHHMGGTRMSDSSLTGIVDRNCQVYGIDNLYVAGSSVFPSCGHSNPTFTIVQLALRLAAHIKSKYSS